ncbi:hypothetical protein [Branchiibius sp. NY16-3462-2]|uniref:hypothetical protein n=1 Tax=Branchiibius sp. NY16-3462-2 TaxID=1807500 RepID=UPI000794B871|nr:hypothetical protein [Branchiibius sp. NY16-3462-2]KYH45146.1 hypothetical protein AZH51_14795 [Branchiibius sp. NY16-3462-2]
MTSFRRRDARMALIDKALAKDPDSAALAAERTAYSAQDWTVADHTVETVGYTQLWTDPRQAVGPLDDPVLKTLRRKHRFTDADVAAIEAIPRPVGPTGPGFPTAVLKALGNQRAALEDLLVSVHHTWLLSVVGGQPPYPFDDVGVLLPLGIETVFKQTGADWKVQLRVIPQPPSIHGFRAALSTGEQEAADRFWQSCNRSGRMRATWLDTEPIARAFEVLTQSVGPARAAWIVTATKGVRSGKQVAAVAIEEPPEIADDILQHVVGLPPQLSVAIWTHDAAGQQQIQEIGTLPQPGAAIDPLLPVRLPQTPQEVKGNWLVDWEAAEKVGLAGTFALPPGVGPDDLGGITVAGIGDESPGQLFGDQVRAGNLGEVVLGAATASVSGATTALSTAAPGGAPALDGAPDTASYLLAAQDRVQDTAPAPGSFDALVRDYLAGSPEIPAVARVRGLGALQAQESMPDEVSTPGGLSRIMVRALWPALWGNWVFNAWGLQEEGGAITRWALSHLYPEGPLPPVRFGTSPYGVLPVTCLSSWRPDEDDPDGPVLQEVAARVNEIRNRLYAGGRSQRSIRRTDGGVVDPQTQANLFSRAGVSAGIQFRGYRPVSALPDPAPYLDNLNTALKELGLPTRNDFWGSTDLRARHSGPQSVVPHHSMVWFYPDRPRDVEAYWLRIPLTRLLDYVLRRGEWTIAVPAPNALTELDALFAGGLKLGLLEDPGLEPGGGLLRILPDDLLTRLLVQSALTANAWRINPFAAAPDLVKEAQPGAPETDQDDQIAASVRLAALADPHKVERWDGVATIPGGTMPHFAVEQEPGRRDRLARALGATIDAVSHRIDPVATGFAWQRLRRSVEGPTAAHRLGAYGWVFGPFIGTPGPTPSGRLHTPSLAQTTTAAILRERYVRAKASGLTNRQGETPWAMNLTSRRVRLAQEYAGAIRAGLHVWEVIGQEVERIVGESAGPRGPYQRIADLRMDYPIADPASPHRTCHGLKALAALLTTPAGLNQDKVAALRDVDGALDALAQLTVIEGLTHAQSRATGRVGAVMDAAAGLGRMPDLDYPKTRPSGYLVHSTVLSVLPLAQAGPDASPGRVADPSVAAFLEQQLGTDWVWKVSFEDNTSHQVSLQDLGLSPVDTLVLSEAQLDALVRTAAGSRPLRIEQGENRAWQVTDDAGDRGTHSVAGLKLNPRDLSEQGAASVKRAVLTAVYGGVPDPKVHPHAEIVPAPYVDLWTVWDQLGNFVGSYDARSFLDPDAVAALPRPELEKRVRLSLNAPAVVTVQRPAELAAAADLCRLLGTPATRRQLAPEGADVTNSVAYEELRARYVRLLDDLKQAGATCTAAATKAATDEDRRAALRTAARWGVTCDAVPADAAAFYCALTDADPPDGATPLRTLLRSAASTLKKRLAGVPSAAKLPKSGQMDQPVADPLAQRAAGVPDGVASLAELISQLAAPQGALPVLVAWDVADLRATTGLDTTPRPALDKDWLPILATVRDKLARVAAYQTSPTALTSWSSSADPWLTAQVDAVAQARRTASIESLTPPSLTVAYGPAGALQTKRVAVGVIDAYGEAIPMRERDTSVAFGFNAPAARAPQAILLAVPPQKGTRLDTAALQDILRETRELMVARTATVDDLGYADRIMRSVWLPGSYGDGILSVPAYQSTP